MEMQRLGETTAKAKQGCISTGLKLTLFAILVLFLFFGGIGIGVYFTSRLSSAFLIDKQSEFDDHIAYLERGHTEKMRWLQNRQNEELNELRTSQESDQRRIFRRGLFLSCMGVMTRPNSEGNIWPHDYAVNLCNEWARVLYQAGFFDRGEPPDIDHEHIRGKLGGLKTG